jgi:SAM-dependent methyltransferase
MPNTFDTHYWETRWKKGETGWDIGYASTPIRDYIDQMKDKEVRILIPGCGNAWEGEYLVKQGFMNTWLIDIAPGAVENFKRCFPEFPSDQVIRGDFFELDDSFDLIFEQTFFCALDPSLRRAYAEKMHALLKPGGKLVGLLFDDLLFADHPPFGGTKAEYHTYFEDLFEIEVFETARNSIPLRAGREFFISLRKPL